MSNPTATHTASLGSQFDKPAAQEIRQISPRTFAVFENGNERARFATRAQAEAWQALRQPAAAKPAPAALVARVAELEGALEFAEKVLLASERGQALIEGRPIRNEQIDAAAIAREALAKGVQS